MDEANKLKADKILELAKTLSSRDLYDVIHVVLNEHDFSGLAWELSGDQHGFPTDAAKLIVMKQICS